MMKLFSFVALAAFAACPVLAQDHVFVEAKPVKDKPVLAITPDRAYILVRAEKGGASFMLFKDPDAKDQAEYDRLSAEAFEEEQERYTKRLARYERDIATYAKGTAATRGTKPEKPDVLTKENFAFTPLPLLAQVAIGPMNRLSKVSDSVYLTEVTPGSYRLYGPVFAGTEGAMAGVCFCLGSVRFEAKAGEIVDMGRVFVPPLTKPVAGDSSSPLSAATYRLQPASPDMPVDPRIGGMPLRPAVYRPAGKLPNFFGLPVNRLEPIPGVFAYDRDRIVDLTGGAASGAQ